MTTHTPGPWHLTEPGLPSHGRRVFAGCTLIGYVAGDDLLKADESIANAHLIAAAPDLLASLPEVTGLLNLLASDDDPVAQGAIHKARAAITRATGEAS